MPDWVISNAMWGQIFALGAPLVEKILRPVIVYVFLVLCCGSSESANWRS